MSKPLRWGLCLLWMVAILGWLNLPAGQARNLALDPILETDWQYTASVMTARRARHTLSVLPDGSVLAAGGYYYASGDHYLNSSEIYNPLTNNWHAAASMVAERKGHTATVLLDGRVLVVGGENGLGILSSAEIFDPQTLTWSAIESMSASRVNHTATRLLDGRVLVVGGCYSLGCHTSAEIYDPGDGHWSSAGSLTGARENHTATLLDDGSVLVAGGYLSFGTEMQIGTYATAYRYHPDSNSWESAGSMAAANYGRSGHSAVLRSDGKVVVVGGYYRRRVLTTTYSGYLASAEVYDPASNAWADWNRPIAYGRQSMAAVLDANGVYILLGGENSTPAWDVEYTDLNDASDVWHAPQASADYLNSARENAPAVILPGGVILIAGGSSDQMTGVNTAETNQFFSGTSSSLDIPDNPVIAGLYFSSSTLLPNGDVMITGGNDVNSGNGVCTNRVYLWERASHTITDVPPAENMLNARCGHTITLLPDGRVLVLGGRTSLSGASAGPGEVFDHGQWHYFSGPELESLRSVLLPDGNIFIMQSGGLESYIFNPDTLTFRETLGAASGAYTSFTATLMKNGKVLIVGSLNSSTAEIFDPETETFSAAASTPVNRNAHTATLLPDGSVMVAGGRLSNGDFVNSVYAYKPDSNAWLALGSLNAPRRNHSAVVLPDGRVVVMGGSTYPGNEQMASIELYNPVTKTWSMAGHLANPRQSHQSLLTLDGVILSIGGINLFNETYDTTEMFAFENIDPNSPAWGPDVTEINRVSSSSGDQVEVIGGGLIQSGEGSSGSTAQSAANQPLVEIIRLDNQQIDWLSPGEPSSDTRFISLPDLDFPDGPVMVLVYTSGGYTAKVGLMGTGAYLDMGHKVYLPLITR